jgi:hypothetical protein
LPVVTPIYRYITVVITLYFGLINDSLCQTFFLGEGALVFHATVTLDFFGCGGLGRSNSHVVVRNGGLLWCCIVL